MKSPRIKLLKTVDGFKVFEVNGMLIRKSYNDQFTNFGQHYRFPKMIPMREFWVDKDYARKAEYSYFIEHMKKEWEDMRKGKSYKEAIEDADFVEHGLRNKDESEQYKIKELDEIGDCKVFLVDGKKIRNDCFIDFTEGGHDLVYDWIPSGEIWIDNAVSAKERPYILAHEYHEREDMAKGKSYNKSHNIASFFERHLRHEQPRLGKYTAPKNKKNIMMETLGRIKG